MTKWYLDYFDPNLPEDLHSSAPTDDRLLFDPTPVADMPETFSQDAPLETYDRAGLQSLISQSIPSTPFTPTPLPPPASTPPAPTDTWTLPQLDWSFLNAYTLANQAPAFPTPPAKPAPFAVLAQPPMAGANTSFQPPQTFDPLAPQPGWGREPSFGFGASGGTDSFDRPPRGNLFSPAPGPADLIASQEINDGMDFRRPRNATPATPASFNLFPVPVAPPKPERDLPTHEKMFGRRDSSLPPAQVETPAAPAPVDWMGALGGPWSSNPDTVPAGSFSGTAPTSYAYEDLFAPAPSPQSMGAPGPAQAGPAYAGWTNAAAISPWATPSSNVSPVAMPAQRPALLADPNLYAPVMTRASPQPPMAPASDANLGGQYWNTVRPRLLVGPHGTEVVPAQMQTTIYGTPFESRGDAQHVLQRRGLNAADYHIQPVYGGHVAIPRNEMPVQAPARLPQGRPNPGVGGTSTAKPRSSGPKWTEIQERSIYEILRQFEGSPVPIEIVLAIAEQESSFSPTATAPIGKDGKPTTSAYGIFQGIKDDYDHFKANKFTLEGQVRLGRLKLDKAFELAKKALGRTPTGAEIYLIHHMGSGAGPVILKADPNASWVETLNRWKPRERHGDKDLAANAALKFVYTNADLVRWMDGKVTEKLERYKGIIEKYKNNRY